MRRIRTTSVISCIFELSMALSVNWTSFVAKSFVQLVTHSCLKSVKPCQDISDKNLFAMFRPSISALSRLHLLPFEVRYLSYRTSKHAQRPIPSLPLPTQNAKKDPLATLFRPKAQHTFYTKIRNNPVLGGRLNEWWISTNHIALPRCRAILFCAANHKKRFLCFGIREISINFVAEGCQAECKANSKFLWVKIIAFAVYSIIMFLKFGRGRTCATE